MSGQRHLLSPNICNLVSLAWQTSIQRIEPLSSARTTSKSRSPGLALESVKMTALGSIRAYPAQPLAGTRSSILGHPGAI